MALGKQLEAVRRERGLTQRDAAQIVGVTAWTIANWEKGRTKAPVRSIPGIVAFLSYQPFPEANTLPERLLAKRRAEGWMISDAARRMGVDEGTWADWEQGGIVLLHAHRSTIARLLDISEEQLDREMAARWNHVHAKGAESS